MKEYIKLLLALATAGILMLIGVFIGSSISNSVAAFSFGVLISSIAVIIGSVVSKSGGIRVAIVLALIILVFSIAAIIDETDVFSRSWQWSLWKFHSDYLGYVFGPILGIIVVLLFGAKKTDASINTKVKITPYEEFPPIGSVIEYSYYIVFRPHTIKPALTTERYTVMDHLPFSMWLKDDEGKERSMSADEYTDLVHNPQVTLRVIPPDDNL